MKLTSILLLGVLMQVSARVHSQTVSFSGRDVPLEKIFASVEKQTGYVFFYDETILKDARPVTIRAENYSLPLFLSCILNGQPYRFSFQNKTIVISRKEPVPDPALPATDTVIHPPGRQILTGRVIDINGTPLSGASVTIRESGKSTLTDGQGMFHIPASAAKSKLIVSFIGYNTREIVLSADQHELYVQLTVAVNALDEEVVQAYGKTSQRLAVGSIFQVSGEDLQKQPVMNPLLALDGKVPGLQITPTSGYASAPVKVEIRGRNTINATLVSDPLYVIDGVPLTILDLTNTSFNKSSYANGSTGFVQAGLISNTGGQSPLFSLNSMDIESITVLKDAAATAIYGSRGANGVILITTKRPKPGQTQFNIRVEQGTVTPPRHIQLLNTPQYVQMRREALKNDGLPLTATYAPDLVNWDTTRYTDWQKQIWGVAKKTDATLELMGGDSHTSFRIGAGYDNQQDITTLNGGNKRVNLSLSLTHHSPNEKLTLTVSAAYGYTYAKTILMPSLGNLAPNAPSIFNAKGDLNYAAWNAAGLGSSFQFASILTPSVTSNNFLNGGLVLNYVMAKGLNMGFTVGYNNSQNSTAYYSSIASQNPIYPRSAAAGFGISGINNWDIEPLISYTVYIGSGKLDCMAGGTLTNSISKGTTLAGFGYTNDALLQSITNAPYQSSSQNSAQAKTSNIHGRIQYNWQNKYILELDGNRYGSSNFGPGRQYGNFWSAGGGWIVSEEKWIKRVLPSWWNFFKLDANYGVTGSDAGGAYQYLSQWTTPAGTYGQLPQYNGIIPLLPLHAVNQDYQWQENRKINADLTLGFLKDRISLMVTWYRDRCNNQLTSAVPTPVFTGFPTITGNSPANVQNIGWEGNITARAIKGKDFSWNLNFNISINRNKLLAYPNFELSPYYTTLKIGKSLNTQYLYHYEGINPQNGQPSFADHNHDGVISYNPNIPTGTGNDDRYIALDINSRYFGGFGSNFMYKSFGLSLGFSYNKVQSQMALSAFGGGMGNIPVAIFNDHWQKPGDHTRYARFSTGGLASFGNFNQSDGAYVDGSYIRLNNVTFSYTLPAAVCKRMHMKGAGFSLNTQNIFIITGYKGVDPQTPATNLPQPKTIIGTMTLNF